MLCTRSGGDAPQEDEKGNHYRREIVAGADAAGGITVSGRDVNPDIRVIGWFPSSARIGALVAFAEVLIEAGILIEICVGDGTAAAGRPPLSPSDLVTEGDHVAKTRQAGVVASWMDEDRVGAERGRLYRKVFEQRTGCRCDSEGRENLRGRGA